MTVIFLLVFCGFGMYRTMWQYASANDVLRIALATLVASLITYLFSLAANAFVRPQNLFRLHRMVYLLFWIISMAMVGGLPAFVPHCGHARALRAPVHAARRCAPRDGGGRGLGRREHRA